MPRMVDWNKLVDDFGPLVVGISWRILGHAADVEDNVQEVFFEAYRIGQKEAVDHWPGLFRRLATYGALAKVRGRKRHVSLEDDVVSSTTPAPTESLEAGELKARLRDAVARLPQREGAVFSLRFFEDLALRDVADALSITYSAAGAALSRARSKLEREFRDLLVDKR